jgi:hypothetical protein
MQWSNEKEQQDKWTNNDLQKTKDQTINYRIQAWFKLVWRLQGRKSNYF